MEFARAAVILSEIFFVYRILFNEKAPSRELRVRITAFFVCCLLFWIQLYLFQHRLIAVILSMTGILVGQRFSELLFIYHRRRLESQIINWLQYLVMRLKSGVSFREALLALISNQTKYEDSEFLRSVWDSLQQKVSVQSRFNSSAKLNDFASELLAIDQHHFQPSRRISLYKKILQTQETFRRRSRAAYRQVHAQGILIGVLYIGIVVWNISQKNKIPMELYGGSFLLFCTGIFLLIKFGKPPAWKI